MSKFNEITTMAYIKGEAAVNKVKNSVKNAVSDFKNDERGVEGFVVALILIGIAAVLAIIFREQIAKFIQDVLNKIRGTLDNPSESPTYGNNATTTV